MPAGVMFGHVQTCQTLLLCVFLAWWQQSLKAMAAILPRRAISADLLPGFDADSDRKKYVLLLGREPRLHVKTKSAQTSTLGCRWHVRSASYSNATACSRRTEGPAPEMLTACLDARSIEICCETDPDNCAHYTLEHSLIEFDEKPAILEIPAASSTRCSLTARGLALDVFQVVVVGML